MPNKGYADLKVWQKAIDLSVLTYKIIAQFPPEEKFGLSQQMRRSAVSVASNIAEGCNRNSKAEFQQFLSIASGSLAELKTQIIIAERVGLLNASENNFILLDEVGRMLNALQNSLKKDSSTVLALTTNN